MSDTEKITINLSAVDLGKMDLLVQEGMFSNRTDFIRTAIRSQLDKHNFEVQQSISRHAYGIGVFGYNRADLERYQARGERLKLTVVGLLNLANDIPAELAAKAVETVQIRGIFQASPEVKAALADRMK